MPGRSKRKLSDAFKDKLGPGEPIICALMLEGESFAAEHFLRQLAKTKIAGQAVSSISRCEDGVFSFEVGDEFFGFAAIPVPYPASDLEGPIATSWLWPDEPAIGNVKRHRSHLLITMTGGAMDPVQRRLLLTDVTVLAAKQPGVMAVYWAEATLVIFPPLFIHVAETVASHKMLPLYLWVDLRAFRNEDGTTGMFTCGLQALGHMEIEIPRFDMEPGAIREWLLNIIAYLVEKGPVLKDGDTIGVSAEQRIRIRHCTSKFGHAGTVLRLEP